MSGRLSNPDFGQLITGLLQKIKDEPKPEPRRLSPRQRQRRLAETEILALVKEFRTGGISVNDLAGEFQIHRQTAASHLDRAGVTRRRTGLDSSQIARAQRLYAQGWSLAQIARELGVWPSSVGYRLRQAGVQLRPRPGRAWRPGEGDGLLMDEH